MQAMQVDRMTDDIPLQSLSGRKGEKESADQC